MLVELGKGLLNLGQHLGLDYCSRCMGDTQEVPCKFERGKTEATALLLELACFPGNEFLDWKVANQLRVYSEVWA